LSHIDTPYRHEKSPAETARRTMRVYSKYNPPYADLAGLSVPRLKIFDCGDYSGTARKKQVGKFLS
jgi:hypothetical protein